MRSTAEVALRRQRSAEDYAQSLREVVTHSEGMSTLVEDLLTLARVDAGIERTHTGSADVVDLLSRARAALSALAQGRDVAVTMHVPAGPVLASGQPGLLLRLLTAVLENAITYSFPGGEVTITVGADATDDEVGGVVVAVSDQGIGLSPEEEPRLFERFFRGARARQHAPDGNGLGLAIAQRIAGACGASLSLRPNSGKGSSGCCALVFLARAPTSPPAS